MNEQEILECLERLSQANAHYGKVLDILAEVKQSEPEHYAVTMGVLESQNFKEDLDLIIFFSEL